MSIIGTTRLLAQKVYQDSRSWFPYAGMVGVVSMVAQACLRASPANFIGGSAFITGALSFAASQIGLKLLDNGTLSKAGHRALIGVSILTTAAFAHFTSVHVITSLALAALGALTKHLIGMLNVELWKGLYKKQIVGYPSTAPKYAPLTYISLIISKGATFGIAYETCVKVIRALAGTNALSVGFGPATLIGVGLIVLPKLVENCWRLGEYRKKQLPDMEYNEGNQWRGERIDLNQPKPPTPYHEKNYRLTFRTKSYERRIDGQYKKIWHAQYEHQYKEVLSEDSHNQQELESNSMVYREQGISEKFKIVTAQKFYQTGLESRSWLELFYDKWIGI